MGVVIVGMAEGRRILDGHESWGMLWDSEWVHFNRLFDLHDKGCQPAYLDPDRLLDVGVPLYLQDNYPLQDVIGLVGDYFQCTISYMLGLAILEGHDEIYLTGVSGDEDYFIQRPNLEYLIGFARGRGAKVEMLNPTSLLKYQGDVWPKRYGYVD